MGQSSGKKKTLLSRGRRAKTLGIEEGREAYLKDDAAGCHQLVPKRSKGREARETMGIVLSGNRKEGRISKTRLKKKAEGGGACRGEKGLRSRKTRERRYVSLQKEKDKEGSRSGAPRDGFTRGIS